MPVFKFPVSAVKFHLKFDRNCMYTFLTLLPKKSLLPSLLAIICTLDNCWKNIIMKYTGNFAVVSLRNALFPNLESALKGRRSVAALLGGMQLVLRPSSSSFGWLPASRVPVSNPAASLHVASPRSRRNLFAFKTANGNCQPAIPYFRLP